MVAETPNAEHTAPTPPPRPRGPMSEAERERLVQERDLLIQELERSNEELQQFAYVVSHDLREPLRMISSYLQLLKRRYEGQLGEDADEFIDFAVDGASRMQDLLRDLLVFSRVGTHGEPFEPTGIAHAIEAALANLVVAVDEADATIEFGEMPTVAADPTQITQLFQHLLDNALKFHADEPPHVAIEATEGETHWEITVADNGIGVDPRQAERVFGVFQRLHERDAYEGTGIGLAVARRIVQRHGGRIWVEAGPAGGAVFHFTLAKTPEEARRPTR